MNRFKDRVWLERDVQIIQVVRLIDPLRQVILDCDSSTLSSFVSTLLIWGTIVVFGHVKELARVVFENSQVLVHDVLVQEVVM